MKTTRILSALLLFTTHWATAQTISGFIRDERKQKLEFANIALQRVSDSSFAEGTLSDSAGYYLFKNAKAGQYRLLGYLVGYKKAFSPSFHLSHDHASPIQQDLVLIEENIELGEVEVRAQKSVVVQEAGKITINVENTVSSAGLMAIDLLRRMPGVQIDNNGNISIKGKSEVLIMIDDKPSYLSAKQIAVILRSLPSNQISNIEVITSPSAKYDAKGNAGIININLKKVDKKGVNGTLQTTIGHGILPKSNFGGSIAIGLKKWQINAMYDFTANMNLDALVQERNIGGPASGNRYYQTQYYEVPTQTHNYRITANYDASKKLALGISHKGMYTEDRWRSENIGTIRNADGKMLQKVVSHDNNPNYNSDLGIGLSAKYKIDSSGQTISADVDASQYRQRSRQNIYTDINNQDTLSSLHFQARLPMDNTIFAAKVDYTKPIVKALKLETGLKSTNVFISNTVEYDVTQTGTFLAKIPSNNSFEYQEQVNAAYASLKWDSTNWSVQLGLRAEHWHAEGKLRTAEFVRDSVQLFPNVLGKYKLSKQHELSIAFSRRTDRPNYISLNPIAYYSDPYTYYVGNPKTLPQSTYHTELAHNYKNGLLVTTINYSNTNNLIFDYAAYQTSDTSKILYQGPTNIPKFENYGIATSLYVNVTKSWTSQAYFNYYYNHFSGKTYNYEINNGMQAFSASSTQSLMLPQGWSVEASGNYSSANVYSYTRNRAMGMLSLGVKKELFAGRVIAKLNAQDIFYTFKYRGNSLVSEIDSKYEYRWDNRVVNFSLVWKLEKKAALLQAKE